MSQQIAMNRIDEAIQKREIRANKRLKREIATSLSENKISLYFIEAVLFKRKRYSASAIWSSIMQQVYTYVVLWCVFITPLIFRLQSFEIYWHIFENVESWRLPPPQGVRRRKWSKGVKLWRMSILEKHRLYSLKIYIYKTYFRNNFS